MLTIQPRTFQKKAAKLQTAKVEGLKKKWYSQTPLPTYTEMRNHTQKAEANLNKISNVNIT